MSKSYKRIFIIWLVSAIVFLLLMVKTKKGVYVNFNINSDVLQFQLLEDSKLGFDSKVKSTNISKMDSVRLEVPTIKTKIGNKEVDRYKSDKGFFLLENGEDEDIFSLKTNDSAKIENLSFSFFKNRNVNISILDSHILKLSSPEIEGKFQCSSDSILFYATNVHIKDIDKFFFKIDTLIGVKNLDGGLGNFELNFEGKDNPFCHVEFQSGLDCNDFQSQDIFIDSIDFLKVTQNDEGASIVVSGIKEESIISYKSHQIELSPLDVLGTHALNNFRIKRLCLIEDKINILAEGKMNYLTINGVNQNPTLLSWTWHNKPQYLFFVFALLLFSSIWILVSTKQTTILFLTANPKTTSKLDLEKEFVRISTGLQNNNDFKLKSEWNIKTIDLQESILKHKPQIVHFSGHGSGSSISVTDKDRNAGFYKENKTGIILENDNGGIDLVPEDAIKNLFKTIASEYDIKIVVLNACYSESQAKTINEHVPFVVGMSRAIPDKAAIDFSSGFYNALAKGIDVRKAFDLGVNRIELNDLESGNIPVLHENTSL